MDSILQFDKVTYYYQSGEQKVSILEEADCSFELGKLYTIVGPSGSGKTTTLTLAGALESPKGGRILFHGKDLKEIGYTIYRNRHVTMVFQAYNLLEYLNPLQNVLAAMEITKNEIPHKKQRAEELLLRMGITKDQWKRRIQKLSGGEQQRVAIARALATDADIVLADEPTGNLDGDTAQGIVKIFQELAHKDGKCVIAVTHSQDFAAQADVVVELKENKLKLR